MLKVVKYSGKRNHSAVASELQVKEKLVRDKEKLKLMLISKRADRGQPCEWPVT